MKLAKWFSKIWQNFSTISFIQVLFAVLLAQSGFSLKKIPQLSIAVKSQISAQVWCAIFKNSSKVTFKLANEDCGRKYKLWLQIGKTSFKNLLQILKVYLHMTILELELFFEKVAVECRKIKSENVA